MSSASVLDAFVRPSPGCLCSCHLGLLHAREGRRAANAYGRRENGAARAVVSGDRYMILGRRGVVCVFIPIGRPGGVGSSWEFWTPPGAIEKTSWSFFLAIFLATLISLPRRGWGVGGIFAHFRQI